MTLALLLTLATGAWAQSTLGVAEVEIPAAWQTDNTLLTAGDLSGFKTATLDEAKAWADVPATGVTILIYGFDGGKVKYAQFLNGGFKANASGPLKRSYIYTNQSTWKFCYTATPVALTRGTGDKINEWSFTNKMPAGNVKVWPIYFPQATAAEGALTAATGVAATTSAPLVTLDASKLTGATKLMYLATKSTDPAPDYDAQGWSDKVPTADSFTEAGGYNVYYYPLGTDDTDPTKTYSDGDICAAPIQVSLDAAPTYSVSFAKDNP